MTISPRRRYNERGCRHRESDPAFWAWRRAGSCADLAAIRALLRSIIWGLFRRVVAGPSKGAENLALRHRVRVLRRQLCQRPKLTRWDRLLFAALCHVQPDVLRSVSTVRPETVVR